MRLISLNTWAGTQFEPLMDFIRTEAPRTDIFCFQEISYIEPEHIEKADEAMRDTLYHDLVNALPDFVPYFAATHEGFNWRPTEHMSFGNVVFVRKTLAVLEAGHTFVHLEKNAIVLPELLEKNWFSIPRLVQHIRIAEPDGKEITVCNFHGLWHKDGKGDSSARAEQSRKLRAVLDTISGPKILCGDFNLNIETESLLTLEKDMRNLIKEFDIKTTRSEQHYPRIEAMPYADYTLVSEGVDVIDFQVPDLPISDHLPMILEFK